MAGVTNLTLQLINQSYCYIWTTYEEKLEVSEDNEHFWLIGLVLMRS